MRKSLELYTLHYDNIIVTGDFTSEAEDVCMESFYEIYGLKSLIKQPFFKNPGNLFCINLIITSNP